MGQKTIDELLEEARRSLVRVEASDLDSVAATGALIVDIRPLESREAEGELPGAFVIDRNVLEWRLDPRSDHRIPETGYGRKIVLVCNEGYASSLAAVTLCELGLDATDLAGGYRAWITGR